MTTKHRHELRRAQSALQSLPTRLPSLAGLAAAANVSITEHARVKTAAVSNSGYIYLNPAFLSELTDEELLFVLAHELFHLALRTHDRGHECPEQFNRAHDYVINDMLRNELALPIPKGGLDWEGARFLAAENIALRLNSSTSAESSRNQYLSNDILTEADEEAINGIKHGIYRVRTEQQLSHRRNAMANLTSAGRQGWGGDDPSVKPKRLSTVCSDQVRDWQFAMQPTAGEADRTLRSYARPSRRGSVCGGDLVRPGRKRDEGWIVHLVFANNMSRHHDPQIVRFLAEVGATAMQYQAKVHFLQCHQTNSTEREFTAEEILTSIELHQCGCYGVVKPMSVLSERAGVEKVVVFHAGSVVIPSQAPPYEVFWAYAGARHGFKPKYGEVIELA